MSQSLDKALDLGANYLSQIIEASKAAIPIATQVTLQTTSFTCLVWVITGFIMAVLSGVLGYVSNLLIKEYFKIYSRPGRPWEEYDGTGHLVGGIIGIGFSLLCLLCSLIHLLSVWHWVGVWRPDIYLVHEAIIRVTSK